jgi:hemolysin activation/secretion protein
MNLFLLTCLLAADVIVSVINSLSSHNNSIVSSNLKPNRDIEHSLNVVEAKAQWLPQVKGWVPYSDTFIESLLNKCKRNDKRETLLNCASLLNTNLIKDGYITSRVYSINKDNQKFIEIIKGKLVEIRISSNDEILKKYIKNKTNSLIDKVLHIPTLENIINEINTDNNISNVSGDLSTLGSDPSKTILNINVDRLSKRWENIISISNQGITGSGELRTNLLIKRNDLFDWNDILILNNEVTSDINFNIGNFSSFIIYEKPIFDDVYFTSSFGISNRKLIEAKKPINNIRFRQIQGLGKITKEMISKSDFKLNSYIGINLSKSESFLSEDRIGLIKGGGDNGVLQTGYLDTGINIFSKRKKINLQGNLSLLQSISGLTPYDQRKNLRNDNIPLSKAKAITTRIDFEKIFNSKISFNSQFNSQIALGKLPSDMSFSFGGEDGFSSLPSSIGSGDSGWFLISSFSREIPNNTKYSLKLSPFFGMGLIRKSSPKEEHDYVGSGGIKMLLEKENINIELGLVEKFLTENNSGSWNNWLLSNGIYTKLVYKF